MCQEGIAGIKKACSAMYQEGMHCNLQEELFTQASVAWAAATLLSRAFCLDFSDDEMVAGGEVKLDEIFAQGGISGDK